SRHRFFDMNLEDGFEGGVDKIFDWFRGIDGLDWILASLNAAYRHLPETCVFGSLGTVMSLLLCYFFIGRDPTPFTFRVICSSTRHKGSGTIPYFFGFCVCTISLIQTFRKEP